MDKNHTHIHLLGNPKENFYTLGVRDKKGFTQVYNQLSTLCAQNKSLAKVLKTAFEAGQKLQSYGKGESHQYLKAYAEGLERPIKDVYLSFILPEVVAAFNKWAPNLMGVIPGCSSVFKWDNKDKGVIHARVLDYALAGAFEHQERSILYEFPNRYKIFSYNTQGMPFPSISSMNEKGLTLALHYKHNDYFNADGFPIFIIAFEILSKCSSIKEVKKLLRSYPSMSYWGFYLSDATGAVASVDIRGHEIYQEVFDIKEHEYLYFNNRPLLHEKSHQSLQPFGNKNQCQMRFNSFKKQYDKYYNDKGKNTQIEVLRALTTPIIQKANTAKEWSLSTITPSSLQAMSFHNTKMESYSIPGPSPKSYQNVFIKNTDLYQKIQSEFIEDDFLEINSKYHKALKHTSVAQSNFDEGKTEKAYHHLQMAEVLFRGHPEQYICLFFFYIWQYIYDSTEKDYNALYKDFLSLEDKLPEYLEDHRQLFLMRVLKILGNPIKEKSSIIKNQKLKEVYDKEVKLNSVAIKLLKKLIIPRIEILDIIHLY